MYGVRIRQVARVAAAGALLLSAGCGGDGGSTDPGGGGGGPTGTYLLVGINNTAVPAVAQMEHCTPSAFTGGSLILSAGGGWSFGIELEDETGAHVLRDRGRFEREGDELAFVSEQFGDQFEGEVEDGLVVLYYDFCANGEADIDFVFEK